MDLDILIPNSVDFRRFYRARLRQVDPIGLVMRDLELIRGPGDAEDARAGVKAAILVLKISHDDEPQSSARNPRPPRRPSIPGRIRYDWIRGFSPVVCFAVIQGTWDLGKPAISFVPFYAFSPVLKSPVCISSSFRPFRFRPRFFAPSSRRPLSPCAGLAGHGDGSMS